MGVRMKEPNTSGFVKFCIILMLFSVTLMSCKSSDKTRRSIRKNCDCPKWSMVIEMSDYEVSEQHVEMP